MLVREFQDMMPHRITVRTHTGYDEWGEDTFDSNSDREYMCLIDESAGITATTFGEDIRYNLAVFADAIPLGKTSPQPIDVKDEITFDPVPSGQPPSRPVDKVEKHYWKDGTLHNMVLRFR